MPVIYSDNMKIVEYFKYLFGLSGGSKYQHIKCNQPTFFDVDDTLLLWGYGTKPGEGKVRIECEGDVMYLTPHKKHIEQIKAHAARGHTVFVWSKGGDVWANAVVKSLGLEPYVSYALEKPQWYYDDCEAQDFMGKASYMKDE